MENGVVSLVSSYLVQPDVFISIAAGGSTQQPDRESGGVVLAQWYVWIIVV